MDIASFKDSEEVVFYVEKFFAQKKWFQKIFSWKSNKIKEKHVGEEQFIREQSVENKFQAEIGQAESIFIWLEAMCECLVLLCDVVG